MNIVFIFIFSHKKKGFTVAAAAKLERNTLMEEQKYSKEQKYSRPITFSFIGFEHQ